MTAIEDLQSALADRYDVERELGRGGMATVYLAKDIEHDRQVAIKVMRPQIAEVMGAERFLREIEIASSLEHPNILALLDSGGTDTLLWYVMPFIDGESLGERIESKGRLGIAETLRITREVASALTYAGGRGVIHRDIKPDNIMLAEDGHAVVMDFGIGKAIEAEGEKLTQTGMSVGTPAYMSPEQAMGEGDVDGRTDVYSLAAVVYEMLIGEQPFTGPTAQVIIAKRFSGHVPSATSRRNVVPPIMDAAIQKALATERNNRYDTAEELVAAMAGEAAPEKAASSAKGKGCRSTAAILMVVLVLTAALAIGL
jgi:serine/threonine protein kinase